MMMMITVMGMIILTTHQVSTTGGTEGGETHRAVIRSPTCGTKSRWLKRKIDSTDSFDVYSEVKRGAE